MSKLSRQKTCTHVRLLVRTAKNWGVVGTSTRADDCAFTSVPQPSSHCHQFQTNSRETCTHVSTPWAVFRDTPCERLAHMLNSLVRVKIERTTANMLDSWVRVLVGLGLAVRMWRHKRGHNTRDNRHLRQQRETLRGDASGNLLGASTRSSAVWHTQCDARLQVGHQRCAAVGGMSISSGSWALACVGVPSSSDTSAMAQTGKHSSASSAVMCLAKSSSWASSATASMAPRKSSSQWARNRRQQVIHAWFLSQRSVTAQAAHSAEDCRRHALFMATSSNEPS